VVFEVALLMWQWEPTHVRVRAFLSSFHLI
jgi:hypothetical protein